MFPWMVQSSSSVQRSSTSCLLLYLLAWIATSTSVCSFHASTGVSPCQEQGRPPVYTFDELRAISLKIPISVGKSLSTTTTSRARRIGIHSALSAASNSDTSSKYYSARKIASRKSQLLWISQSVQKIQAKERIVLDRHPSNATTTLQSTFSVSRSNTALDTLTQSRVVDSQLAVGDCHTNFNTQLVQALELLSSARTAHQVLEAGRLLDVPRICQCQPVAVLERVAKATAMTGLLHISLAIVEHMLQLEVRPVSSSSTATTQQHAHPAHLPSIICQDAICNALRQAGRINRLEQLLCQMGSVANRQNSTSQQISLAAFNTYLAALCNIATRKDATASQQQQLQQGGPDSSAFGFDASVTASLALSTVDALDRAWYWIRDPVKTKGTMAVTPDKVSFATVIQAAAAIGNETLVNAIWKELRNQTVSPNIVAYNARLRSMISADTYRSAKRFDNLHDLRTEHKKRDLEILSVWDEEISRDISVQADKYTIDLLLLPLIRCGRIGDVESLLDTFVKRHSEKVVSNSFTAFLITVVDGGELASARALFETYILPTLSPVMVGDAGAMIRMVRPMTRHFNVLLEGYRKQAHCTGFEDSNVSCDINHQQSSAQEAYVLYRMMTQAWGTRPDAFTITSMMGLCQSSTELSNLLVEAISEFNVECSSIFLRAALTAYGDLGDASSALWLFSKFPSESTRTWNVLLGSLAKAAEKDALLVVEPMLSQAARTFQSNSTQLLYPVREIVDLQRYSTLLNAVEFILDGMSCSRLAYAPRPDSQSFCIAASALQYSPKTGEGLAIGLFRNATQLGVLADGRFVNAMLRCYGIEIDAALAAWRDEIRPQCMAFDKRQMRSSSKGGGGGRFMENNKNMVASYNGLLYVCGRSLRPDIALRILYAMKRDGLEPNEASLNSYKSGRRRRMAKQTGGVVENETNGFRSNLEQKLYESLLFVECTKYDLNDKRRSGEKRVRIIL